MKEPVAIKQSTVRQESAPCNVCSTEDRNDNPDAVVYVIELQTNPIRKASVTVTYCKKHMLAACSSFAHANFLITGEKR